MPEEKLLRITSVMARTGWSRSSIYREMAAKRMPQALSLGLRACCWKSSEIDAYIESRQLKASTTVAA